MPFGMVGMDPGMRQVVGFGDPSTGMGNFGGKCRSPHCNQWGVCGVVVPSQITLGFLVSMGYRERDCSIFFPTLV